VNIRTWIEKEVEANIDFYGNTKLEAIEHIRDLLNEDEYRDELTDEQVAEALRFLRGK
jgi:hypothetical protein